MQFSYKGRNYRVPFEVWHAGGKAVLCDTCEIVQLSLVREHDGKNEADIGPQGDGESLILVEAVTNPYPGMSVTFIATHMYAMLAEPVNSQIANRGQPRPFASS